MRSIPIALLVLLVALSTGCKNQEVQTTNVDPPMTSMDQIETVEGGNGGAETDPPPVDITEGTESRTTSDAVQPVQPVDDTDTAGDGDVRIHVVRKGDTLWSISKRYLGDGKRWKDIVAANPGLDPNKLRVGHTLKIPPK